MTITLSPEGEAVLRDAVQSIELNLEHWDQCSYAGHQDDCGTYACLAGWIVTNTMYEGNLDQMRIAHYRDAVSIPHEAMCALGIHDDMDYGKVRAQVFNYITDVSHDDAGAATFTDLQHTPAALKVFKARLTEVFGLDF